jgi:hypothetical protein
MRDVLTSFSIANVLLQSGQTVPEWMIKLQKPSRLKRKQMGKAQHQDSSVGHKGENVGRSLAVKRRWACFIEASRDVSLLRMKRREMIAGSKRRKREAIGNEE